jgi:hypothetical protein
MSKISIPVVKKKVSKNYTIVIFLLVVSRLISCSSESKVNPILLRSMVNRYL